MGLGFRLRFRASLMVAGAWPLLLLVASTGWAQAGPGVSERFQTSGSFSRVWLTDSLQWTRPPVVSWNPPVHPKASSMMAGDWFAQDKLKHFLMSFAATGFAYGGMRVVGLSRKPALAGGALAALGAGTVKELSDRAAGRHFSGKDMVWNCLGIAVAVALLANTR